MFVYASFDPFPAPKGAATHIAAFARSLTARYGELELVTVSGPPEQQLPPGLARVRHQALPAPGKTLIDRVLAFRRELLRWWGGRVARVAHVRSIYEGYPLARAPGELCERLVYEVNGLPSIELKYHYPDVADDPELLAKLEAQERTLLLAADLVLTPSQVTGEHLLGQGLDPARLHVIPNGVDLGLWRDQPPRPGDETLRLLYAGTLTAWQGVFVALEALQLYRRDYPAHLTLVGPGRKRQRRKLAERIHDLGLSDHVALLPPCTRAELVDMHHQADVVLAPLLANDRNLVQGCCPLKVLEAMASGTPLIASDLPVVRELARFDEDALLVRPGSAKAIKDGLLRLRDSGLASQLSRSARQRVEAEFTWDRAGERLLEAYATLGLSTRS